jgi:hypothetical protein
VSTLLGAEESHASILVILTTAFHLKNLRSKFLRRVYLTKLPEVAAELFRPDLRPRRAAVGCAKRPPGIAKGKCELVAGAG